MKDKIAIIFAIFLIFYNAILGFLDISILGYFDEIMEIVIILYGLVFFIYKRKLTIKKKVFIIYVGIITTIFLGLMGNIVFRYMPNYSAILKDILQFLKFPIIVMILEQTNFWEKALGKSDLNYFIKIMKFLIIIMTIFGIVSIFKDIGLSQNEIRHGIKPYQFLFNHPTYLVLSCVYILAIINAYNGNNKTSKYEIVTMFLIALSMRTKGFAIIAIYLALKYFYKYFKKFKVLFFAFLVIVVFFVAESKLNLYSTYSNSPREAMYRGAITLATKCFPVGSGFGTFASHISGKYESKVYDFIYVPHTIEVGASENVLGDAGIPYYIGQFGFIGIIIFSFTLYNMFKYLFTDIENKVSLLVIVLYIIVAITTESILINSGMELAVVITFIRYINLYIAKNKSNEKLLNKGES